MVPKKAEQKPFITSVLCECGVGPGRGKPASCLAQPDHHRGPAGYVSLILYLTETKSIVSPSLVSCVSVIKEEKERESWPNGRLSWMDLKCPSKLHFEVCVISPITLIRKR